MSLNVTINGFAYLENATLANSNVYFQALWYPNGTASSPTTWSDVRLCEPSGYWSLNCGDASWLTQEGTTLPGGKIVIVFWKGATTNRNDTCSVLEEWGATEINYDGASVYTLDVQTRSNIDPTLVWSLEEQGLVGITYTAINSSYDVHNWTWNSTQMYHWRARYGQIIQSVNTINRSNYYWGNGDSDLGLTGTTNGQYTWNAPGIYNVTIEVEDACAAVTSGTKQITIKNNAPVPSITCHQAVGQSIINPNTELTFQYSGTDPDNVITSIDWVIEDVENTTISGVSRDSIISHINGKGTEWCSRDANSTAFTTAGTHKVSITVHWFDGFNNQTIKYNEDFEQLLFTGPALDFIQSPVKAIVGSGTNFINNSTNVGRVGEGPPNCHRYDWIYYESGTVVSGITDVPFSTVFSYTPTTGSGLVQLCAKWHDGWDTHTSCVSKSVVFGTKVTVTPEDCYYNLNITGTSSDGTVSGYSWDIYRDASVTGSGIGPWELIWSSPEDLYQNDKKLGFTSVGYYKIQGYVHGIGSSTTDYEILYIDAVCDDLVTSNISIIWNGTGFLDSGGDWSRGGHGVESPTAKFGGTNGLDATGFNKNKHIQFTSGNHVDVSYYDLLIFQLKINSWEHDEDKYKPLEIKFDNGNTVNIVHYINFNLINEWQRVYIPLDVLNVVSVNQLTFNSGGDIDIYLDDIAFAIGTIRYIAVEDYKVDSEEVGRKHQRGAETKPSMQSHYVSDTLEDVPKISSKELDPDLVSDEIKPSMQSVNKFPPPFTL